MRSTLVHSVVLTCALFVAALAIAGCETAEDTALLSAMFGLNAMQESNPQKAAGWQSLSDVAGWSADQQAQERLRQTPQTIIIERR